MAQYSIRPINEQIGRRIVTAIDVEEQYTPQGTQTVLNVEDVDFEELLKGRQMEKLYDLDDITLIPRVVSTLKSRDEAKPSVELFPDVILTVPIIASPMMDVCDGAFALKMRQLGGFGFIHRFQSIGDQVAEFYKSEKQGGCAIGLGDEGRERFDALYAAGCRYFCLDVANGANSGIYDFVCQLNAKYDVPSTDRSRNYFFIVGNVASKEVVWECSFYPVAGVRVGIAGGGGCTTKNATGIYHPMASLIQECFDPDLGPGEQELIIADGGINSPDRFCKALALGAHAVMMGSALAVAKESPSQKVNAIRYGIPTYPLYNDERIDTAIFRGSASFEVQQEYREPRYIEGKEVLLPYKGETLETILGRFMDGLRSSMSYFDARTLEEYRANVTWGVLK